MRHLLATLTLLAALAAVAGYVTFRLGREPAVQEALAKRDALAWLQADFKLTDAQFAKIRQLHDSYSVVCEDHCRAIQDAARARAKLQADAAIEPARLAAAKQREQELRQICENAIAAHVKEVAAVMSPAEGARYLALVMPKIADFDHKAAPDVGLNSHRH